MSQTAHFSVRKSFTALPSGVTLPINLRNHLRVARERGVLHWADDLPTLASSDTRFNAD